MQKSVFSFTFSSFLFTLNVLVLVCLKIMKLREAMALGTHFVDSKHDQNIDVSLNIIMTGRLPLPIRLRALSVFQHVCLLCD